MAQAIQQKINQLSKDFNLGQKEVINAFKELNIEKKTGASVDFDEFELFLDYMTKKNQIKNLEAYTKGEVKIKVLGEQKAEAPKAEAPKAEAPKAEAPKAEAPKAEAPKAEAPKAEPVAEIKKPQPQQSAQRPQQAQRPDQRPMQRNDGERRPARDNRENRPDNRGDRTYNKYNAQPQANPFAKKYDSMNRDTRVPRPDDRRGPKPGQPAARPDAQRPAPVAPKAPVAPAIPVQKAAPGVLPAQQKMLEKQEKRQEKPAAIPVEAPKKPKANEKKPQKQQFKTITPGKRDDVQGGVNIGGEYTGGSQPKTRGVDMRTSDVDLSK
jgi:hypothetical protein